MIRSSGAGVRIMHEAGWIAIAAILATMSLMFLRLLAAVREAALKEAEAIRLAKQKQEEEQAAAQAAAQAETPIAVGA